MSSRAISNLVRALTTPYIGAHISINNTDCKVWRVDIIHCEENLQNIEPGRVVSVNYDNQYFDVKSYDGLIRVVEHDIDDLSIIGEYL